MATGMQVWSTTPVNNATSDSNVNWAEGMAPSQVNDSARAVMASAAKWVTDNSGVLATSGTSTALTLATNQVEAALTTGFTVTATLGTAMAAAATLAVDGLTATSIFTGLTTGTLVTTGQYASGQIVSLMFSTGVGPGNGWVVRGAPLSGSLSPPVGTAVTASLASSVTVNSSSVFVDGPSVQVSTASTGTWLVTGNVTLANSVAGSWLAVAKLWDGTTVIDSAIQQYTASGAIGTAYFSLSGVITNPTTSSGATGCNLKISCVCSTTTNTGIAVNNSGLSKDSTITAVRIA